MIALRLSLYQQTACYKKPFAFKVSETYPLPPYSTVKGMLHAILEATSLIPMKISIQGSYDTLATDYQTHYFFKKDLTNEFAINVDGLGYELNYNDITAMPIYMHMLYNVNLLIHVLAEEKVLYEMEKRILSGTTHLSMGRWEDLVRVDDCEIVKLTDCDSEPILKYNAFVPIRLISDETHLPYNLNWTYKIINGVRVWDKIPVGYIQQGEYIEAYEDLKVDTHGDITFFP